jgi:hypothetical protein
MKTTLKILTVVFLLLNVNFVIAQDPEIPEVQQRKGSFAVAGLASTNGLGFNLVYAFNDKFALRGGFERLGFSRGFNYSEDEISYDATLNYKTGSFSLLADYYFLRHVYITGGVGLNRFNPEFEGHAASDLEYGDISIPAEQIGDFDISVDRGLRLSPYAGLGFGRNIGLNKNVAFNFEIGAYYLGTPDVTVHTTGLLSPTSDPAHGQKEYYERQLESYRFYPVLKFGVSVKLF